MRHFVLITLATLITAVTVAVGADSPEDGVLVPPLLAGEPAESLPPDLAPLHFEGEAIGTPKLTSDTSQETFAYELDDDNASTIWCPNPNHEGEPNARFYNLEGDGPPAIYSMSGMAIGSSQNNSPYFTRARVVVGDRQFELALESPARWHVFQFPEPVNAAGVELSFLEPSTGALEGTCVADVIFFGSRSSVAPTTDAPLADEGSDPDTDTPDVAAGITALGYEIVNGPDMGELRILLHGQEAWSIETYMVSYELRAQEGTGLFEVLVDTRENRQSGTQYLLELSAEGVHVLDESDGPPSGINPPAGQRPNLDDLN